MRVMSVGHRFLSWIVASGNCMFLIWANMVPESLQPKSEEKMQVSILQLNVPPKASCV